MYSLYLQLCPHLSVYVYIQHRHIHINCKWFFPNGIPESPQKLQRLGCLSHAALTDS